MKKVVVFLADGCEEVEALTPVDLLRRAGVTVTTVSVNGKKTVTGSHKIEFFADEMYFDGVAKDADMVILPGGMPGTLNLRNHKGVTDTVKEFCKNGKYIAAICAAPSVFGQLGLLEGKKAVCYPSFEEQLTNATVLYDEVAVDGNVITSRGMGTAIPFSLELIKLLCGEEKAKEIKEAIIFNR